MTERVTAREERLLEPAHGAMAEGERLDELALGINHLHGKVVEALGSALRNAVWAGEALLEAKGIVGHGGWLPWLQANFPFDARTAQRYMRLARDLPKNDTVSHLSVSGALKQIAAESSRPADPVIPNSRPAPPVGAYRTIVADPPWQLRAAGATKANARKQYPTMHVEEVAAMAVPAHDDCHLWLWAINSMVEDAYRVVRAWGFEPLTLLTWCKPGPGVGHYLRNNTEQCILAARGAPMVPADKPRSSWYQWPRREHSRKPDEFYALVRQASPGPRLDMFAREAREGFETWGNETERFPEEDAA